MSDGMNNVCRGLGQIALNEMRAHTFEVFSYEYLASFDNEIV